MTSAEPTDRRHPPFPREARFLHSAFIIEVRDSKVRDELHNYLRILDAISDSDHTTAVPRHLKQ